MYVRLAFAVAIHSDPDILLVDEVLAVGDQPFQEKCMASIRQFQREGRTIIFVSHSADQVLEICDRVLVLDHGNIVYDGVPRDGIKVLEGIYSINSLRTTKKPAANFFDISVSDSTLETTVSTFVNSEVSPRTLKISANLADTSNAVLASATVTLQISSNQTQYPLDFKLISSRGEKILTLHIYDEFDELLSESQIAISEGSRSTNQKLDQISIHAVHR